MAGKQRIVMIDNYDSFTYNLVQYLGELGQDLQVYRNDAITLDALKKLAPDRIVISPGPGAPKSAGISMEVIKTFGTEIPTLGVCLGHQCIGEVFGAKVERNYRLMHGKTSPVEHDEKGLFKGLPNPFEATRYHSLILNQKSLPKDLMVCARTEENEIMGIRHTKYPIAGVQFHPESILTKSGMQLLKNFLKL